jgi:hypothetical protein
LLFFLIIGFMLPAVGSDRGLGQLFLHLALPYWAAWEAMPHESRSALPVRGILFLGQIGTYVIVLGHAWIKNRLGSTAAIFALVHFLAIAVSVLILRSTR